MQLDRLQRREFVTLFGGALAMPPAARAQQRLPVIGLLSGLSPGSAEDVQAFRQGLRDTGYVEHQTVGIEYRWGEGRYERLPAMAADLVHQQVVALFATPTAAALAAKAATATIPVVFLTGADPVQVGLVTSLNRPGGNVTGTTAYVAQLSSKRLDFLHKLVPNAATLGVFVNPNASANADPQVKDLQVAATSFGLNLRIINVGSDGDIDPAFSTLVAAHADALFVTADAFLLSRRDPIVALAARHRLPAMYPRRGYVDSGGLISYTTSVFDAARQAGVYTGRILKGEKPGDLPVTQPTKFELIINLKTARALGLEVPDTMLAIADEVLE
jgi:putative ABC transport system substrate-binding protein